MTREDSSCIPETGLGTTVFWYEDREAERSMERAISDGLSSMIDTAEMYGSGRSEEAVGRVLAAVGRERVYLVDKILPENATPERFSQSLERSLKKLGTDYIDLYLLHWREAVDVAFVAEAMTEAVKRGLILRWGVSNFDVDDMEDLFAVPHGPDCYCNQVLYNLCERGVEYDLFPWMKEHGVWPMSYSSLGSAEKSDRRRCECSSVIQEITRQTGLCAAAVMLYFNTRNHDLSALFSSRSYDHIRENLRGVGAALEEFMPELEREFPAPDRKVPLAKI